MPVKRSNQGPTISERYERGQKRYKENATQWDKRVAKARTLRPECATWRDLDAATPEFVKMPITRRVRQWCEQTGVSFTSTDEKLIGLLVSVAEKFRGLWLSTADLAKRVGCSVRTIYNVTRRLEAVDVIRVVPQYDDVDPYLGRTTSKGKGSSGKRYTRQQRPNVVTFGQVGRAVFGRAALSKRLRRGLGEVLKAVDTLFVSPHTQTRQPLPTNAFRSKKHDQLVVIAHAVNNPKPRNKRDHLPIEALENLAKTRTRRLLHLVE